MSNHLHGHYSLCYFVHRHPSNAWYNKVPSLTGKSYLAIITSNESVLCEGQTIEPTSSLWLSKQNWAVVLRLLTLSSVDKPRSFVHGEIEVCNLFFHLCKGVSHRIENKHRICVTSIWCQRPIHTWRKRIYAILQMCWTLNTDWRCYGQRRRFSSVWTSRQRIKGSLPERNRSLNQQNRN